MGYFKKVKKGQEVYGLVFGIGFVKKVFDDSFYKLTVEFKNGHEVPYTEDGIPGWGKFKQQTLFFKDDIDLTEYDFSANTKVLDVEKIIKLREKKKLQIKLPSGLWCDCKKSVRDYMEEMLEKENFHLFRKKKKD